MKSDEHDGAVAAPDPFGIAADYQDAFGRAHRTSAETRAEVLRAMGVDPDDPRPPAVPAVRIVRPGDTLAAGAAGELHLEDGTVRTGTTWRAEELPIGYHTLIAGGGEPTFVIASPGACHLPDDLRGLGFAVQLYAARSRASWGIGDLADLRALGALTRELGGRAMMVNPLCAPALLTPVESSPYYPSSRRFRNPLYLRIEEIPGATALPAVAALAETALAQDRDRRIDRDRILPLKMQALEAIWAAFAGDPAFDAYRREQGRALDQFAAYATLAERHGKDWRRWPEEYRHPEAGGVARLVESDRRVAFHAFVQWLIDEQLRRASAEVKIIHDLPIGLDIAGADAWCWQDTLAAGISVGCPPDEFNSAGQDWGLAPFIPTKIAAARFTPFIETIRAMLRHAGGLRIDHVMGLFRLYWIPHRLGAKHGTYVQYPSEALLEIVAVESQRAQAFIVGEDLGNVAPGTREAMARLKMLSYRLLYFEPHPPAEFPELALSSVTTHDLATIGGLWTGAAAGHARGAGVTPNEAGLASLKEKLARLGGVAQDAPLDDAIVAVHRALARAPSRLLLATLDDALAVTEQPNLPGTTTGWPNWSLALPLTIEEIQAAPLPRRIAEALTRR